MNELLIIASLFIIYGSVILWFRMFGKSGLFAYTALANVLVNIEVLLLVHAFGISMNLGNVLFASTFLVTDILSELYGKKDAQKCVNIGITANVLFIIISQTWIRYIPAAQDWAHPSMVQIFSNTPRMVLSSLVVYFITQHLDVWMYHKWWDLTEKLTGESRRFLWLRNNGSTLISQLLNTSMFTVLAFWGTYPLRVLLSIIGASYIFFIFTTLLDTPFIYWARHIYEKKQPSELDT